MKIKKRQNSNPVGSMSLWLVPTLTYITLKSFDMISRNELIWLVGIPSLFTLWFIANFKINKK